MPQYRTDNDDAVGAGKVKNLKIWWDELVWKGQKNYYDVNGNNLE